MSIRYEILRRREISSRPDFLAGLQASILS
jgi:hypothetical protein